MTYSSGMAANYVFMDDGPTSRSRSGPTSSKANRTTCCRTWKSRSTSTIRRPIGIRLPTSVVLEVIETEPGIKKATATTSFKPAKLETGITVQVPPFVSSGEKIRVNTDDGSYIERA